MRVTQDLEPPLPSHYSIDHHGNPYRTVHSRRHQVDLAVVGFVDLPQELNQERLQVPPEVAVTAEALEFLAVVVPISVAEIGKTRPQDGTHKQRALFLTNKALQ